MEYVLADGTEGRPIRAEPVYLATTPNARSQPSPAVSAPEPPADDRQRQGRDQRAGTAGPGKRRVRREPPGASLVSPSPGTLPRLPGACRAVAREAAVTWPARVPAWPLPGPRPAT